MLSLLHILILVLLVKKKNYYSCWCAYQLYQKQEWDAALLVKNQKTYALLEADDDDDHDVGGSSGNGSYVPASSPPRKEYTETFQKEG